MNKTIVAYRSKTGYTQKYARRLAEELGCDCIENPSLSTLLAYDTILYGGGLYIGKINGIGLVTKNFHQLKDKRLIVFAVGISPGRKDELETLWKNNLPEKEMTERIQTFYLRGGFDYHKLSLKNKFLMYGLKKMHLEKIKNPTEDDKGMLAMYDIPQDFTDLQMLGPILQLLTHPNASPH